MDRLLFKFYKSYFDVGSELNDKDRLAFYDALLNKQFNGIEPTLTGISKLAYISQKHSIDLQVKGWEDKMGTSLNLNPNQGGTIGGAVRPTLQEKEEVKEKEKEKLKGECFTFDEFWSLYPKKVAKEICGKKYESLSANDKQKIKETLPNFILHKPFKDYTHPNPSTYLNQKRWNDEIITTVKKEELKFSVNFQHPDSKLMS